MTTSHLLIICGTVAFVALLTAAVIIDRQKRP
jgi:hypothetical protein